MNPAPAPAPDPAPATVTPPPPAASTSAPAFYVGIGASAGGLEALEQLFAQLPVDSGSAFVVIQHLSPDYKSMMVELLSKRTTMPVWRAEEGVVVQPNNVYLIPPKKQLTIFHGRLVLSELDYSRGINLPIDVFLRSLAEDQGEKAVAVILSGTGSDGVRGIRSIKECGGMVFVQKPETARFDGMPKAAISTGLVDVVLPVQELPGRLASLTRQAVVVAPQVPQVLLSDEDGLTRIMALLREQANVDFTYYKPSTILRRIERRMAVNQVSDLREYVRLLELHPSEVTTLYRELLIGVTSFYRDRAVFDTIRENWLPALFQNAGQREYRFWVTGCSTGEEAYTLAILAIECLGALGLRAPVKIFATDIDREAIVHAGNGVYGESIAADLPPGWLNRYFVRRGDQYQIQRFVRELVVFAQHNLTKDPPFTNVDLLSCRNLLIYLQPVLQQKVMESFAFSLNPGGILLLGTSETPGEMTDHFEALDHKSKIYRSRGKRPSPGNGMRLSTTSSSGPLARRLPSPGLRVAHQVGQREEERIQERLLQVLSEEFAPLMLVVNDQQELLQIAGNADGLLRLPQGKLLNDLSRMAVKELAIPLATGLQKVFADGRSVTYTRIRLQDGPRKRLVQMRLRLLPVRKGQIPLAAVLILDSPTRGRRGKGDEEPAEYDLTHEAEQRIRDLEQELQFNKENLQATIEELETSNEELQAANEELLASNEELQSTNEELQSVNEELHTVNAEHQSKILELTELTNDFDNLMEATRMGTLFLDGDLNIRKFTAQARRIFGVIEGDAGRPFSHINHQLVGLDPLAIAQRVERGGVTQEIEVNTVTGDWFLMRVMPYRIGTASTSGVLFTFTDINPVKRGQAALEQAQEALGLSQASLRSAVDIQASPVVLLDHDGRIVYVNAAWRQFLGSSGQATPSDGMGLRYLDLSAQVLGTPTAPPEPLESLLHQLLSGARDGFELRYSATRSPAIGPRIARFRAFETSQGRHVTVLHDPAPSPGSSTDTRGS